MGGAAFAIPVSVAWRDLTGFEQVLDMVVAIARIYGDARYLEPILQTALDGLRPPTDVEPA